MPNNKQRLSCISCNFFSNIHPLPILHGHIIRIIIIVFISSMSSSFRTAGDCWLTSPFPWWLRVPRTCWRRRPCRSCSRGSRGRSPSQRPSPKGVIKIKKFYPYTFWRENFVFLSCSLLKGAFSRDFFAPVFFLNQLILVPLEMSQGCLNFFVFS